jgi:hypothetical protein
MYNCDGLPLWYVNVLESKDLMQELKESTFEYLDRFEMDTAFGICSYLDIDPIFEPEVEEFIKEWERA